MESRSADLKSRLAAHTPEDPTEAAFLERMHALLETEAPFSRSQYEPGHFTASAFVLAPSGDAILLIHHSKLDRWLQPGGHVDPDDVDIVAASRREVHEEVGLVDLPLVGLLDVDIHRIPPIKGNPAHEHFDVRFLFRAPNLDFAAGSDALAGRWVRLVDVNAVDSDESVMRAVRKLLRAGEHLQ